MDAPDSNTQLLVEVVSCLGHVKPYNVSYTDSFNTPFSVMRLKAAISSLGHVLPK